MECRVLRSTELRNNWRDYSRLILSLRTQAKGIESSLPIVVGRAHNEHCITPVVDIRHRPLDSMSLVIAWG